VAGLETVSFKRDRRIAQIDGGNARWVPNLSVHPPWFPRKKSGRLTELYADSGWRRGRLERLTWRKIIQVMHSPGARTERFSFCPAVGEACYAIDDDSFQDAAIGIEFPDNFDAMACVTEFCPHASGVKSTRVRGKDQNVWDCVRVKAVDSTAREKILEELNRRWIDALLDEDYRARARLLVMMLSAVVDDRGEVPEHQRKDLRTKMEELTADLPRIESLLAVQKAAAAIKLVGDSLPDPVAGLGLKTELALVEVEQIRIRYPSLNLKPSLNGNSAPTGKNGSNGHSNSSGNGPHGNGEGIDPGPEPPEQVAEEPPWRWMSCGGPGQGWQHAPRRQYRF
jgi:hypothetical protein